VFYENFERAKQAEEARARADAQRAQQAASWGGLGGDWAGFEPRGGWEGARARAAHMRGLAVPRLIDLREIQQG
jgi:hypothetical protein